MSAASVLAAYPGPDHDGVFTLSDPVYTSHTDTVSTECAGYYPTGVHTYNHMYFYGARTNGDVQFSGQMWIDWMVGSSDMQGYVSGNNYGQNVYQTLSYGKATTLSQFTSNGNYWSYSLAVETIAS